MGSINVADVVVDFQVLTPDGQIVHLADVAEQLTLTEILGEAPMKCLARLPNTPFGGKELHELFGIGVPVRCTCDLGNGPQLIQDFRVWDRRYRDEGRQSVQVMAYDPLYEISKDEATLLIPQLLTPANELIRDYFLNNPHNLPFNDRSTPNDGIPEPTVQIQQRVFRGMSRMDYIKQVLQWAWERGPADSKDPFFPRWRNGQFELTRPGMNPTIYTFREDDSVSLFEHQLTATDLVTEVFISSPQSLVQSAVEDLPYRQMWTVLVPQPGFDYQAEAEKQTASGSATQTTSGTTPAVANPLAAIAQEAADLLKLAEIQQSQKIARIRKVLDSGSGDTPWLTFQQALDTLAIQGIPWDIRRVDVPLVPTIRRGDAVAIFAGTMYGISIVTSVEHDCTARKSHLTFDSSGILGRRVRRQHFLGPLPGSDDDLLQQEIQAAQAQNAARAAGTIGGAIGSGLNQQQTGMPALPIRSGYDANTPSVLQRGDVAGDWGCSAASTAWMLNSMGYQTTMDDVLRMANGGTLEGNVVNSHDGLTNSSGTLMAEQLASKLQLPAHGGNLTWQQIIGIAGRFPLAIGGSAWNHWTGVRGYANGVLLLANPAPGYHGIGDTMTEQQFNEQSDRATPSHMGTIYIENGT